MMFCSLCGKEISDNSAYCLHCGGALSGQGAAPTVSTNVTEMSEIHITAKKQTGKIGSSTYYIYVDGFEYKYSSSAKTPLVISVTPEPHIIEVTMLRQKNADRISKIGDLAGSMSSSAARRAKKTNSIGAGMGSIVGSVVWAGTKMMSPALNIQNSEMIVDMASQKTINLKIKSNYFGKIKIEEE